jgi:oxygen-dependent protoporphyrinogen oxidase
VKRGAVCPDTILSAERKGTGDEVTRLRHPTSPSHKVGREFATTLMSKIVVIGGGITGLAVAHRVLERSMALRKQVELVLIEGSARLGGIVQTDKREGFLLERGPDSFLSEKTAGIELAKRLQLESHLIETNQNHRRSFIVRNGRLLPVPAGFNLLAPARLWPLVTSDIFSWPGKARMALDLLLPRGSANGSADESLAQFVRRRLGREALERMAQPMVGGIYTADPETLSLQATMPRFLEMERQHRSVILALRKAVSRPARAGNAKRSGTFSEGHGSGARYGLFLSYDRGMQVLTNKLAERISNFRSEISDLRSQVSRAETSRASIQSQKTTTIQLNTTVESLELEREPITGELTTWKIRTNRGETLTANAVCLALPSYVSAGLLRSVDAQLASELAGISYASSATINLAYKRDDIPHPLDGFGFVVPFIEKRTAIACTFSSVKFAGRAPEGNALLRVFVGGALQPEVVDMTEAELVSRVRDDLRDLLGIQQPPLFTEVSRWNRSMPQYNLGHIARIRRIEDRTASLLGLALAGNAYSGLGIPDCIRSGEAAAEKLLNALDE